MSLRLKHQEQLQIVGMHCATCAITVRKAIVSTPGVEEAEVNLASGEAKVILAGGSLKDVVKSVRRSGYDVILGTASFLIDVRPEEFGKVRQRIEEMEGVVLATISATGVVRVEYNPYSTSASEIERELTKMGFKVERAGQLRVAKAEVEFRSLLQRLLVASIFTALVLALRGLPITSILSSAVVVFYAGIGFHKGALRALRNRSANMDTLVSLSSLILWAFSSVSLLLNHLRPSIYYFDGAAMLVTFILVGRSLESYLKFKSSEEVPSMVRLKARKLNGELEEEVDTTELNVGDLVAVKSGERVPVDGVVNYGEGEVEESLLTGESKPVLKRVGDPVLAGAMLVNGYLQVRVTRSPERGYLAQVVRAVREAQAARLPVQDLVDKVSAYFVPLVMAASLLAFSVWYFLLGTGLVQSILIAVSVLAAACPCALGLATPLAVLSSINRATRKGIVIRRGEALQSLREVKAIVFDKTGTLTEGKLKVIKVNELIPGSAEMAAAAEERSSHPVAKAIASLRRTTHEVTDFEEFPGQGVYAKVDGVDVIVGRRDFIQSNADGEPLEDGDVLYALNGRIAGSFTVRDSLRADALDTLGRLLSRGIRVVVATGDSKGVDINGVEVHTGLLPEEKVELVRRLKSSGKVAFVGDGINDAAAMAEADVGIAFSSGTDLAKKAGDVIVPNLHSVLELFRLSERTLRKVKQNLTWAFGYNALLLPLAAGILYPELWLPPQYSALAMSMSSVIVSLWSFL
ncbi:copper-translocating P-type ATPase [Sulfodiicoccus acidiphilus]|uniref:Copper-translocating P-type ATPase n=1 Tax=Sulfodiicoccus acidiphilus TaxID=1670455 RepID=A0A348B3R7_9CREN|nr:cation-translocating P-type ATPase [Sulfodiicoccus acidiphilus]BBD72819.1 copper-translocating P-type ATPase [Sulfodiicoccus acidiphilus]GGU04248.1 copper-translocating P-type ATPase [Sulfodiicoccus acidiphilus]